MNRGDQLIERAAARLQQTAAQLAAEGGVKAKLAETLAEDAAFIRQLKPSLVRARMKGEARTDGSPPAATPPRAPGVAQLGERPTQPGSGSGGGPSPLVVVAAAFAVGIAVAKVIDWRSHAHPRL